MGGSGLIYAAIVAAWAAVLVPRWVRRHEELERVRTDDRANGVRVLQRRAGRSRAAARTRAAAADPPAATPGAGATQQPAIEVSPPPALPCASTAAARRRRVLAVLLVASAGLAGAAVAGLVPEWSAGVPVPLFAGYLLLARRAVARERVAAQAARAAAARRRARAAAAAAGRPGRTRTPSVRPVGSAAGPAPVTVPAPGGTPAPKPVVPERALAPAAVAEHQRTPTPRSAPLAAPGTWQPVPVPLPTYVTAPKARPVIRRIDLSGSGAWTTARPRPADSSPGAHVPPPGMGLLLPADPLPAERATDTAASSDTAAVRAVND